MCIIIEIEGDKWFGDVVYIVLFVLFCGFKIIDVEVMVVVCEENGIFMV